MEQNNNIEKQIELKRLEIEKLRLEKELNFANQQGSQAMPTNENSGTFPIHIIINILFLIAACVSFYILPWGSFSENVHTDFGSQSYLSNGFTGYNLGLFTYSIPLTIINITLLIFIVKNSLKYVFIISIVGLIIGGVASSNLFQVQSIHLGFSSSFGTVTSGIVSTGYAYILPISYCLLVIFNFNKKNSKVISDDSIKHDKDIYYNHSKIKEAELEELRLKEELENSYHNIDTNKYLFNVRIEICCLIVFTLTYFLTKDDNSISKYLSWMFLFMGFLLINNILIQFFLTKAPIKNSHNIVLLKLILYCIILIVFFGYLVNEVFLNSEVIPLTELSFEMATLILITIILISVINEKEAIQLNVNTNPE